MLFDMVIQLKKTFEIVTRVVFRAKIFKKFLFNDSFIVGK